MKSSKRAVAVFAGVLLIFTLSVIQVSAAELTGKITGINGDEFYIEMSTKELPQKGDPVSIILDLDGEGFEAGKAEVVEANKNRVTARTTEGSPAIDMKVLIQSTGSMPFLGDSFTDPTVGVDQLKKYGKVKRGWLGVNIQNVDQELANKFNMERPIGALVAQVVPGSPADKAGIRPGDVIVKYRDKEISTTSMIAEYVGKTPVGEQVKLEVVRDGKPMTVAVTIAQLDEE